MRLWRRAVALWRCFGGVLLAVLWRRAVALWRCAAASVAAPAIASKPPTPASLPSEHPSESGSEFDAIRARQLRAHLRETDVEQRLTLCVKEMLQAEEAELGSPLSSPTGVGWKAANFFEAEGSSGAQRGAWDA